MSERIMTLFGEELIPEQLKAVGKSRAKKKTEEQEEEPKQGEEVSVAVTAQPADLTAGQTAAIAGEEIPAAAMPAVAEVPVDEAIPLPVAAAMTGQPATAATAIAAGAATEPEVAATKKKVKKEEKKTEEHINLAEDWQGEKQYYSIGEVSDLFKVKTSHIRFWTNEFKLKVRTTRKGDRLFTPEQIRELRTIHHLVKERGFTLAGAKAKLKEQNNMDVQTIDLKQSLLQLRNKLVTIKNQLN
jgi:DNA-binding transcriptional MerR regulator